MKAAVMFQKGELPQYRNVPEPVPQNGDELLVSVKAVSLKHFDRGRASGTHYSSEQPTSEGRVMGGDGICLLADGTRVYGMGVRGMLAEKAIIEKARVVIVPDGIDDAAAAALPNAVIGAAMALRFKAGIQVGDVVLINGATGFTGRVAVQLARFYGAQKIIVTGRNEQSLRDLLGLGADEAISINQRDEDFLSQIKDTYVQSPIDIIIDYLWGHSAEMILASLKGNGSFTHKTRYVSVGAVTGDIINLSAATLRSVDLQLSGSGLGSWSKDQVRQLFAVLLPEAFQLAADGKLKAATITVALSEISSLWDLVVPNGQRLVVLI